MSQKMYDFENMDVEDLRRLASELYVRLSVSEKVLQFMNDIFNTIEEWSKWSSAQTDSIGYARAQADVQKILAGEEWVK